MKMTYKSYVLKFCCLVICILLCLIFLASCTTANISSPVAVKEIEVGNSLPNIETKFLGLGDLYKKEVPDNLKNKFDQEGIFSINYYSTFDDSRYFAITKKRNFENLDLNALMKKEAEKLSLSHDNYRIGKSEVYARNSCDVLEAFFVDFQHFQDGSSALIQKRIFLDDQDVVFWEFGHKCFKTSVGQKGVGVSIPVTSPRIFTDKFGWNNVKYSYESMLNLPTVLLMTIEKNFEIFKQQVVSLNSSRVSAKIVDGMQCTVMDNDDIIYGEDEYVRSRAYMIEVDDVVSSITFADPPGVHSYAFDALEKGITKQ